MLCALVQRWGSNVSLPAIYKSHEIKAISKQWSNNPINSQWTKLSPAIHFLAFKKPFYLDTQPNMEDDHNIQL